MTDRELMQMALAALKECYDVQAYPADGTTPQDKTIELLRARLAQPEPEPIAWLNKLSNGAWIADVLKCEGSEPSEPLYTAPPKREWIGLTKTEFNEVTHNLEDLEDCWIAIEAKLKEKNNG